MAHKRRPKRTKAGSGRKPGLPSPAEDAPGEARARLEYVLATTPVVIYSLRWRDGRVTPVWISESVERVLGYAVEEAMTHEWWVTRVHPEDRATTMAVAATLGTSPHVAYEYRFRHKDGTYRWLRDELRGAPAADGKGVDLIGAWLDVTAQHTAQEQLLEREARFRRLIENAHDTILVLAADGTVEYASPSVQVSTGFPPSELEGRRAFEFTHPDDVPTVRAAIEQALREPGRAMAVEFRYRHADGSWRYASAVGRVLAGEAGPPRLVVNSREVTERRRLESQLRQAQKLEAVGQLTAGIVHDFNNMLSVVISNAELIAAAAPPELVELRADVGHIKRAAQGGAELVGKLLAFSRQAELTIVPTDLRPVVRDVRAMLARIIPASIEVRLEVREPLPCAHADGGAVQQILLNLATNARDAMPQGGTLTIELGPAKAGEKLVVLEVTDTGMGMDEATQARIFEPFFTTKPPGKGTGLGMPMIFGLVQQHGGHVDVQSRVGAGTTVRISLPAAEQAPVAGASAPGAARGGSETVLLVDDEPALRRTGKRILEAFGYTVLAAADGEEALRLFEERRAEIALVVSDLEMPKLGGLELCRQLRERGSAVRFVCASGFGALQLQERDALPPDVSFIQKPWTMEEFARTVRSALDAGLTATTPEVRRKGSA